MNLNIQDIKVPIIKNGIVKIETLREEFKNKKIILFGVPGAFTPTCSEKHLPSYISLYKSFKNKKIDEIFCLSVNDEHVMKTWLLSYSQTHNIHGIADGNAEVITYFNLLSDKTMNYMGIRSKRFAMVISNNKVQKLNIEKASEFKISSAEAILKEL